MNDTSIPVHDAEDSELCASENCGACAVPASDEPVTTAASPTTDIHDHPSYGLIDDVFGNSSNVVEFHAGPVAVGRCGAVDDDGCIRLMASGHGLIEYGAASIHLDPAYARQLLGELGTVAAPAKTHDLTVRRDTTDHGRALIAAEDAVDDYRLYLPVDDAKILGRMLGHLTPAQVAILADALTDGAL